MLISSKSMGRRALWRAIGVVAVLGLVACTPPPKERNTQTGGDGTRDVAKALFPGQNVTDSISDPEGDHTDWKVVRIREPGNMSVTIAIDTTRGMDGSIAIRDGLGVELERRPINASDNLYTFDQIPVYLGEYFIEVDVDSGASTYTAGVKFEGLPTAHVDTVREIDPIETPKWNGVGKPPKETPKDPVNPVEGPKDPVNPVEGPKDPDVGEPAVGASIVTLQGYIIRIAPIESGGSLLTITNMGSADGVKPGMSGTIVGLSNGFQVTTVRAHVTFATTQADAEDVKEHKNVTMQVKR